MKISLKTLRSSIIILTLMIASGSIGYSFGSKEIVLANGKWNIQNKSYSLPKITILNKNISQDKNLDFNLFWKVWDKLEEKYFDKSKLNKEKMFYGAIQGMTAAIGDPYTMFLPPLDNKQAKEDLNGSFEGVGIKLGFNKDGTRIVVMSPLKGSPAEQAGIRPGDYILHIKDLAKNLDTDTAGMTLNDVVENIRGEKNTVVTLTIQHESESNSQDIIIKREPIVVASVEVVFLKNDTIAQLSLLRFGELTQEQWDESVLKITCPPSRSDREGKCRREDQRSKLKGVILDVRGNPGGYLSGAVNLASEFLDKGIVVKQENYQKIVDSYSVNKKGRLLDIPLVVLIDKGSASASEILAGALQDHKRAKIIGVNSFGKGTIQETEDLSSGAGLHITTAKWLTPNGTWVDKKGLTPDYIVENDPKNPKVDKQLEKAIEIILSN